MRAILGSFLILVLLCGFLALVIYMIIDVIRRSDLNPLSKAVWIASAILIPPGSALIYAVANRRRISHRFWFGRHGPPAEPAEGETEAS